MVDNFFHFFDFFLPMIILFTFKYLFSDFFMQQQNSFLVRSAPKEWCLIGQYLNEVVSYSKYCAIFLSICLESILLASSERNGENEPRGLILKDCTFQKREVVALKNFHTQIIFYNISKPLYQKQVIQMNNEKALKEEINRLTEAIRKLQQQNQTHQHQNKKALLEAKTKLEFQNNRADEYEEKYKSILQYKNQEESLMELDQKLRQKEDQVLALINLEYEKSQQIKNLLEEIQVLKQENNDLNNNLNQIKEAALSAIIDKDTTIGELTQKLQQYHDNDGINNLKIVIIQLEQKYRQLEERSESTRHELTSIIEQKQTEIVELQQKIISIKDKHEDRIGRLEQDILDYEKHIEEMAVIKDNEENLEEKYYHMEEKSRKLEKKLSDAEIDNQNQKQQLMQAIQKLETQNEHYRNGNEQLKESRNKLKEMDKEINSKKRQLEDYKQKLEKIQQDHIKKISHIESEKKIISQNFMIKQQEIEKLKAQLLEQKLKSQEPILNKEKSSSSPQKVRDQDNALIEKLKKQNKDLEQINQSLKKKLEEQTKELQQSRQKLLQARGSDGINSQANKLRLQIQDLTSYLKKVENDMLMKKITHAQDENFWSIKQKKYKEEFENLNKKYKKEISQLLQRIDRMKKLVPKDKKTDYYQSGFK